MYQSFKHNSFFRSLSHFVIFIICFSLIFSPNVSYAQSLINPMPAVGSMVTPTEHFVPLLIKGMTIHPENPLNFDFIIDSGYSNFDQGKLKQESERLIKYFLASLTVPKEELWVNLSPYEKNRIIPEALGKTELGRDLLAQDYLLKQLTASLMYPEDELGKKFWDKIYQQAFEKYGTTDIPVDTFNKVWIIPEKAVVYENEQTVYVVEAKLKVLLEQDYREMLDRSRKDDLWNTEKQSSVPYNVAHTTNMATNIIREIIIPAIEKEVNEGENFAALRQIYNSLILAKWYKETVKNSILSNQYVDQNKTAGINDADKDMKEKIYTQYMQAYQKGVYDYIKDEYDPATKDIIPRKYFSGGFADQLKEISRANNAKVAAQVKEPIGDFSMVTTRLDQKFSISQAMITQELNSLVDNIGAFESEIENFYDIDRIVGKLTDHIKNDLFSIYKKIGKLHGIEIKKGEDPNGVMAHTITVLASLFQLKNLNDSNIEELLNSNIEPEYQKRILRLLKKSKDKERIKTNLKWMRSVLQDEELDKWIIACVLHDIGKLKDNNGHETIGYEFVKADKLLSEYDPREQASILLFIKYHLLPSMAINGELPFSVLGEMIEEINSNNEKLVERGIGPLDFKTILDEVSLMWMLDVSGYAKEGFMDNGRTEFARSLSEFIKEDADFEELSVEKFLFRLAGLVSFDDGIRDENVTDGSAEKESGIDFYVQKFKEAEKKIDLPDKFKDKQSANEYLDFIKQKFHLISLKYANYLFFNLLWSYKDGSLIEDPEYVEKINKEVFQDAQMNPNFVKLMVFLSSLVGEEKVKVSFGDVEGDTVDPSKRAVGKTYSYILGLNEVLSKAYDLKPKQNNPNTYSLVDKEGKFLDGMEIVKLVDDQKNIEWSVRIAPVDHAMMSGIDIVKGEGFQRDFMDGLKKGFNSFEMIKPDGRQRKEELIQEFRQVGFDVVPGPEIRMSKEELEEFYKVHKDRPFFDGLIEFMLEGPTIPLFLFSTQDNAIERARQVIDHIRTKWKAGERRNFIHGSDKIGGALFESQVVFNHINQDQAMMPEVQEAIEGLNLQIKNNFDALIQMGWEGIVDSNLRVSMQDIGNREGGFYIFISLLEERGGVVTLEVDSQGKLLEFLNFIQPKFSPFPVFKERLAGAKNPLLKEVEKLVLNIPLFERVDKKLQYDQRQRENEKKKAGIREREESGIISSDTAKDHIKSIDAWEQRVRAMELLFSQMKKIMEDPQSVTARLVHDYNQEFPSYNIEKNEIVGVSQSHLALMYSIRRAVFFPTEEEKIFLKKFLERQHMSLKELMTKKDMKVLFDTQLFPKADTGEANKLREFLTSIFSQEQMNQARIVLQFLETSYLSLELNGNFLALIKELKQEDALNFLLLQSLFMEYVFSKKSVMDSGLDSAYTERIFYKFLEYLKGLSLKGMLTSALINEAINLIQQGKFPKVDGDWSGGSGGIMPIEWPELEKADFFLDADSSMLGWTTHKVLVASIVGEVALARRKIKRLEDTWDFIEKAILILEENEELWVEGDIDLMKKAAKYEGFEEERIHAAAKRVLGKMTSKGYIPRDTLSSWQLKKAQRSLENYKRESFSLINIFKGDQTSKWLNDVVTIGKHYKLRKKEIATRDRELLKKVIGINANINFALENYLSEEEMAEGFMKVVRGEVTGDRKEALREILSVKTFATVDVIKNSAVSAQEDIQRVAAESLTNNEIADAYIRGILRFRDLPTVKLATRKLIDLLEKTRVGDQSVKIGKVFWDYVDAILEETDELKLKKGILLSAGDQKVILLTDLYHLFESLETMATSPITGKIINKMKSYSSASEKRRSMFNAKADYRIYVLDSLKKHENEIVTEDDRKKISGIMRMLAGNKEALVVIARNTDQEIIGYAFARPQRKSDRKGITSTIERDKTFYAVAISVDQKYQGNAIGLAMRDEMMRAVQKKGYRYLALRQENRLSKDELNQEIADIFGRGKIVDYIGKLPGNEQYISIDLQDKAMMSGEKFTGKAESFIPGDAMVGGKSGQWSVASGQPKNNAILGMNNWGKDDDTFPWEKKRKKNIWEDTPRDPWENPIKPLDTPSGRYDGPPIPWGPTTTTFPGGAKDWIKYRGSDRAMLGDESAPGGIDMNNIEVDRHGKGVQIEFDAKGIENIMAGSVEGFVPVIINITPIHNILPLLGLDSNNGDDSNQELTLAVGIEPENILK